MLIRGIMETPTGRSHWWWSYDAEKVYPSLDYMPLFKEFIELKPSICGVQLLVAQNNEFFQEYATLSKELRWLRLVNFQKYSCLPSWLSLENLRVLELYGAPCLKELWDDHMQQPLQLRQLIIHLGASRSLRRFPRSIGSLRHLKKLSCRGAECVQNLPEKFCDLQSLEHLELQHLSSLSSLPSCFGDLTNLRHLNLAGCYQLKMMPDSFRQLKHLQYLNLQCCRNLTFTEHNADFLENITNLEYLNFSYCKGLQVVPHHITRQTFLREVNLKETSFSELPNRSIDQLKRLEVLRIGSEELESLPDSLGNLSSLTFLEIHRCSKVRSLPESLGRLARLESISICETNVKYLPKAFGHLISLQDLSIKLSPIRELIFEFESSSLPALKTIYLQQTKMSTMSIPEDCCPSLESLSVETDDRLVEIRTLPRTLKTIKLLYCEKLEDIAVIGSLRNLQSLTIKKCPELAELPSFAEFASIREIRIMGCQISGKIEGLEQVTSLETLEVHTQWEVPGITSLEHAQVLRTLRLSADNTGAVEPCIKTLQKWPGEVLICARVLGDVELVVKAFTSSNLMVVEACDVDDEDDWDEEADVDDEDDWDEKADEDGCTLKYRKAYLSIESNPSNALWEWSLGDPESHEASIVCIVINCLSQDHAHMVWETGNEPGIELREGKWVWIRVVSHGFEEEDIYMRLKKGNRIEKGFVGRGEEREVKDVFYQVLDALKL